MQHILILIAVFAASFLLGSIPFGVIISKVFYKTDIREHGSGNIGTTNAIRTMGKVGGYSVFVLDFGKGIASGLIALGAAWFFFSTGGQATDTLITYNDVLALAFLGCTWGHIFSPWLGFHGGKGIAVAVGCLFMTFGVVGACLELAIFIVLVVLTRYVSVGSVAAAAACPAFALYFFWGDWPAVILCSLAGLTVVWAHRENIKRLLAGEEHRVGDKKDAA
ncbi:MAG: glycerol-3-phosphate 1-O-acyltransferase PlsY [Raoultibacter sp.]